MLETESDQIKEEKDKHKKHSIEIINLFKEMNDKKKHE